MKTIWPIILLFSIPGTIFCQHKVSGVIRDYEFGDMISNVKVFVDSIGYYKLNKNDWQAYSGSICYHLRSNKNKPSFLVIV